MERIVLRLPAVVGLLVEAAPRSRFEVFWRSREGEASGFDTAPGGEYPCAMPSPWYRDGLRFECTQCGHCCTGAPGYVWVTLREIDELASFLGLGREEFARRYLRRVGRRYSLLERPNGDCVFYDRGCTVYPARPEQCRTFPFWPENLESEDAWKDAGRECPGMGKGRFYPLEEIRLIREGSGEASEGRGGSRRGTGSRAAERRSG